MRTVEEIRAELPRVAFAADRYVATRKSEQQYEIELRAAITTNIPIDRLKAICAAEKDGRLVTLPCKRGDTAYRLCGPKGRRRIVERPVTSVEFNGPVTIIHSTADDVLGKTVFLTRDEAEKTLGKEQDER